MLTLSSANWTYVSTGDAIGRNDLKVVHREIKLNAMLNTSPVETVKIQGITNVIVLLDDKMLLLCFWQCVVFVAFQLARRFLRS